MGSKSGSKTRSKVNPKMKGKREPKERDWSPNGSQKGSEIEEKWDQKSVLKNPPTLRVCVLDPLRGLPPPLPPLRRGPPAPLYKNHCFSRGFRAKTL